TVTSDASNSSLSVSLSGTGMQPALTISPASLNFSNVVVGQISTQTVTLTNSGNAGLTMNLATISGGGFGMSGLSLPSTIAAGANLQFNVTFTPTSTSGSTGSVVFTDNATGSPQTLALTGSAVTSGSSLGSNPGSFNFNSVAIGQSSQQSFTLTNSGNATVRIGTVTATGTGFSASGLSAGQQIAAGASATVTGTFAPTTAGAVSGSIVITSNATNPTLTITLSGMSRAAKPHTGCNNQFHGDLCADRIDQRHGQRFDQQQRPRLAAGNQPERHRNDHAGHHDDQSV